jgi:small subunit ribosomal protein S7
MANKYLQHLKGRDYLRQRFINCLFRQGKKSVAEGIFDNMIKDLAKRANKDGLEVFEKAIDNVKPMLEVRSKRIGGATYQVPVEVSSERQMALTFRWVIGYARARKEKNMAARLAAELMDASRKEGSSIKKREDTHKMAEANRAFAHYRW